MEKEGMRRCYAGLGWGRHSMARGGTAMEPNGRARGSFAPGRACTDTDRRVDSHFEQPSSLQPSPPPPLYCHSQIASNPRATVAGTMVSEKVRNSSFLSFCRYGFWAREAAAEAQVGGASPAASAAARMRARADLRGGKGG